MSLFDSIAVLLPSDQREYFYRRMAHFENLAPEDDILRIVEAMGFLTFIIRDAPVEMAAERERLAELLAANLTQMQAAVKATAAYHKRLEARLARLPEEIAKGINPDVIAARVGESLRQRFQETGLPRTAEAIEHTAGQLHGASVALTGVLERFADPDTGATARIKGALLGMTQDLASSADSVREMSRDLRTDSRSSVLLLCLVALTLGVALGRWVLLGDGGWDGGCGEAGQGC